MATARHDSDYENEEPNEDEIPNNTRFQIDFSDLLGKSLSNAQLFENLINEIEELRILHDVKPSDVPRVVMHCLLLHPRSEQSLMGGYLNELREILRTSSALVKRLRGGPHGEKAMDYFAHGVEEAIKDLHERNICLIRQHVVDLLNVIKSELGYTFNSIYDGLHSGRYGTTPDESLPFGNIPLFKEFQHQLQPQEQERQQQLEEDQQPHNHVVAEPAFAIADVEQGAVEEHVGSAETVDGSAISHPMFNGPSVMKYNDTAHCEISDSWIRSSGYHARSETESSRFNVNLRFQSQTLVSEPVDHEDERQDGSEQRLSGNMDIMSHGDRVALQDQGLSNRQISELLTIGVHVDNQDDETVEEEQNDASNDDFDADMAPS